MTEAADSQAAALANSPARQLLAALNRASHEMERQVAESCDYVTQLNSALEKAIKGGLDEASEKFEGLVKGHIDSVSTERDSILLQLAELRQDELRILQNAGRDLRQALERKLDEILSSFRKVTEEQLQVFQQQLNDTNSEVAENVELTRKTIKEKLPGFLEQFRREYKDESEKLEQFHNNYQENISKDSASSLSELTEHCNDLRGRLDKEGESFLKVVDEKSQELSSQQTNRLEKRLQSFSEMEQQAAERIETLSQDDIAYLRELPGRFSESCQETVKLQIGLHANAAGNLALQYRTEILSKAQEAEDQVQIIRTDLQTLLRQYQTFYSKELENSLNRFKKSAFEFAESMSMKTESGNTGDTVMAAVSAHLDKLRLSTADTVKLEVTRTEHQMDNAYEDFKSSLESVRKEACERLESNHKQAQTELATLQQNDETSLQELSQKLFELEKSISEAKELISALDEASLDF